MTWVVLIATISDADLRASLLASLQASGLPTSSWTKEGFFQNLIGWIATSVRLLLSILREIGLASFLSTATDQALIDLGQGTYGTAYRRETFAVGTVTLLNESGLPLDEVAEAISFALKANPTITYRNSVGAYALNGTSIAVPIICDIAGTVGNAAAGVGLAATIELTTALTGVSLVSNTAIVGQDAQDQDAYRALCSKQAASASTGQGNKYEWFALNTNTDGTIAEPGDDKTRTNINRAFVTFENSEGEVYVVLASPAGPVDPTEFATTVAVLEQYALTNPGILLTDNAIAVEVDLVLDVVLRRGTSPDGVEGEIAAQLQAYFPETSIGGDDGFLTRDEIRLEVGRANPRIHGVTVTTPAADVALSPNEVATLGTLTVNITVQP